MLGEKNQKQNHYLILLTHDGYISADTSGCTGPEEKLGIKGT